MQLFICLTNLTVLLNAPAHVFNVVTAKISVLAPQVIGYAGDSDNSSRFSSKI